MISIAMAQTSEVQWFRAKDGAITERTVVVIEAR